jgi:hypothetical protein
MYLNNDATSLCWQQLSKVEEDDQAVLHIEHLKNVVWCPRYLLFAAVVALLSSCLSVETHMHDEDGRGAKPSLSSCFPPPSPPGNSDSPLEFHCLQCPWLCISLFFSGELTGHIHRVCVIVSLISPS